MFRTLRLQHGLTQAEIAEKTNRSPNYILKAEDLTFPTPPSALVQLYVDLDQSLSSEDLKDWYYESQRKKRIDFLEYYIPLPLEEIEEVPFREMWNSTDDQARLYPTQYRMSKGLCLPASVLYAMEKYPHKPTPVVVLEVLDQLIRHSQSGALVLELDHPYAITNNLIDMKRYLSE